MKRFFKSLFYMPEHEKLSYRNIVRLLMPSVIGIVICVVCMAGMSLAWFSANAQTRLQDIKSADYGVNVTVQKITKLSGEEPLKEDVNPESDGRFLLYKDNKYEITITAYGTATKGYCVIQCDELEPQYTDVIATGNHLVYTYTSQTGGLYSFKGSWGTCTVDPDTRIKNGDTIGASVENIQQNSLLLQQSDDVKNEISSDIPTLQSPASNEAASDATTVHNGETPDTGSPSDTTTTDVTGDLQSDQTPSPNQSIDKIQPSQTSESVLDNTNQPNNETPENTESDDGTVEVDNNISNSENSSDESTPSEGNDSAD